MKKIERHADKTVDIQPIVKKLKESRWCKKNNFFIDIEACQAKAKIKLPCSRCMEKWRQPLLPFPDIT